MLKLKNPKIIKLGTYPYTYVRSSVMRSLLFRRDDYNKMLKMGFSEIAKFMQESSYKKEINELGSEYSGAYLLELALNKNLAGSFKKLIRISSEDIGLIIREYAKRKDIEDIKTILRGKFTGENEKVILNSITGAGTLSIEFLASLIKKDSIEEILRNNGLVEQRLLENSLEQFKDQKNLAPIENALDQAYYVKLMEFSKTLPREGTLFRDFLLREIQTLNILTLLRLKKAKFTKDKIKKFIIPSGNKGLDSNIINFADTPDFNGLSMLLSKIGYKNAFEKGIEDFKKSGSLILLEAQLYKYLLRKSILLIHQHQLSVDVILGYMLAKDIEIRNLKIIIKGKQLGLKEEFIEGQLVYLD